MTWRPKVNVAKPPVWPCQNETVQRSNKLYVYSDDKQGKGWITDYPKKEGTATPRGLVVNALKGNNKPNQSIGVFTNDAAKGKNGRVHTAHM